MTGKGKASMHCILYVSNLVAYPAADLCIAIASKNYYLLPISVIDRKIIYSFHPNDKSWGPVKSFRGEKRLPVCFSSKHFLRISIVIVLLTENVTHMIIAF